MVFSSGRNKQYQSLFDGREVELSNDYKYLGIYFTCGGSFNTAKKYIAEQANKALFSLLKKINSLSLPRDLQLELFDRTIKPILLYEAEIWGVR